MGLLRDGQPLGLAAACSVRRILFKSPFIFYRASANMQEAHALRRPEQHPQPSALATFLFFSLHLFLASAAGPDIHATLGARSRYGQISEPLTTTRYYGNILNGSDSAVVIPYAQAAQLPECGILDLGQPVRGKWYQDELGHYAFELDSCRLRRISAANASRCLAGKRIVFMGDSVTRWAEHAKYVQEAAFACTSNPRTCLCTCSMPWLQ